MKISNVFLMTLAMFLIGAVYVGHRSWAETKQYKVYGADQVNNYNYKEFQSHIAQFEQYVKKVQHQANRLKRTSRKTMSKSEMYRLQQQMSQMNQYMNTLGDVVQAMNSNVRQSAQPNINK